MDGTENNSSPKFPKTPDEYIKTMDNIKTDEPLVIGLGHDWSDPISEVIDFDLDSMCIEKLQSFREKHLRIVAVEGPISAGKSTLHRRFKDRFEDQQRLFVLEEPLEHWQNTMIFDDDSQTNMNILDAFYTNPKLYAGVFQFYAMASRVAVFVKFIQQLMNDHSDGDDDTIYTVIMERSPLSDCYCFFELNYRNKLIDQAHALVYRCWFNMWVERFGLIMPDAIGYLRLEPEVCLERCQKRARDEESTITLEYMQQLHERHEEWLHDKAYHETSSGRKIPIFTMDALLPFHESDEVLDTFMDQIDEIIKK